MSKHSDNGVDNDKNTNDKQVSISQKRRRKRYPVGKEIAEKLDLPVGAVGSVPVITIRGNYEMMLSDCEGVLLYSETEIRLKLKGYIIGIVGERLRLDSFYGDQITVSGTIFGVNFEV